MTTLFLALIFYVVFFVSYWLPVSHLRQFVTVSCLKGKIDISSSTYKNLIQSCNAFKTVPTIILMCFLGSNLKMIKVVNIQHAAFTLIHLGLQTRVTRLDLWNPQAAARAWHVGMLGLFIVHVWFSCPIEIRRCRYDSLSHAAPNHTVCSKCKWKMTQSDCLIQSTAGLATAAIMFTIWWTNIQWRMYCKHAGWYV